MPVHTVQIPAILPRITILTPCLNGACYIGEAIESVRRQHYADLEHIVLDAGSTDDTLKILAHFPEIRVISEPDQGAHDAMNKGVRRASGEIIGFLNTDDIYPDGLLQTVGEAFANDPDLEVAVGGSVVFTDDERRAHRIVVSRDHAREDGFWLPELVFGAPGFNGRFFRRRMFGRIGEFNNDYFIAADRHFLLRTALAGCKSRHLDRTSIYYRLHSGSATINAQARQINAITREHIRMSCEFICRASNKRRGVFKAWHAFECARLAFSHLRSGRVSETARILAQLTVRDPIWPAHLAYALALKGAALRAERRNADIPDQIQP